jgi:hypothetical protein
MSALDEDRIGSLLDYPDEVTPLDLGAIVRAGRRSRHRRQAGFASISLASVAGIVAGSMALAGVFGSGNAVVSPAHHGDGSPSVVTEVHPVPEWSSWPPDRVYGTRPGAGFFTGISPTSVLGSGTLPGGMQFRFYLTGQKGTPVMEDEGYRDQQIFGDEPAPGSPQFRPHAPYFAMVEMTAKTWDHGNEDGHGGFWLVILGQPGTTSASYSANGLRWQPMHLEDGIAAIKVPWPDAGIPVTARIKLSDSGGLYAAGSVRRGEL